MNINFYYKYKVMSASPKKDNLNIQLGDIIEINAPSNPEINNKLFFVEFISKEKIKLIGKDKNNITLTLNSDGELDDESIDSISIINRPEEEGYAKQNKLVPNTWVDIYFGGEIPLIITGLITNLENDMIEIKTYPNEEIIYIDFEYQGLPEDLLIEKINIRNPPTLSSEGIPLTSEEISEDAQFASIEDSDLVTLENTPLRTDTILLEADQIEFGVDLDEVTQIIEVPESEQRYGIEKQTTDMLNELLSTIPNAERTPSRLNLIHTIIERFKQLRKDYSVFEVDTNIIKPKIVGENFKPLVESLKNLSKKLYWIFPISINNKKIYDIDIDGEVSYLDNLTLSQVLIENSEYTENWKSNLIPDEQNKYDYYLKQLSNLATPFTNTHLNEFITQIPVNSNLFTIIDTLGDEQSYAANEELIISRFISQVYNIGLSRLKSDINENRKIINTPIKITENDIISLKGFMFLPLSVYKFSHINLPTTNILTKSNLNYNFLQYWKVLNHKTIINNTFLSSLSNPVEWDESNFLNNIKQIFLDETIDKSQDNLYEKYLDTIIPKTRVIFNLLKKNINSALSFNKIIQYLEPFLIYDNTISYKQYEDITNFLNEKILDFKKRFALNSKKFLQIYQKLINKESRQKSGINIINNLFTNDEKIKQEVFKAYNISDDVKYVTNIELLDKMIRIDNASLFMSSISKITLDLMVSNILDQFLEIEETMKKEKTVNDCKKYVLSKKYFALDELEDDNDKEIYFDKKYDNTFYDIINEYKNEEESMSPEEFNKFLIEKLEMNIGLSKLEAEREAKALLLKRRPIIDGDYAILEVDSGDSKIYKRDKNIWILDPSIKDTVFFEGNKFFCESQFQCFEKDEKCLDDKSVIKEIQKKNLKKIINEFDHEYKIDLQRIKTIIDFQYNYNLENIKKIISVETINKLKYNNNFINFGTLIEDTDIIISPHELLKEYILGQEDFVKKQIDIIQFTLKYTREAYLNEDKYWLYCKDSNIKLLPKFISDLAQVFIRKEDYKKALDFICAEQGTISEDGDKWIDKYSGYEIRAIDLNTEEGFDESGYKLQTRELLEDDAGNILLDSTQTNLNKKKEIINPTIRTIQNVVLSLSQQMSISIQDQMDFIIKNVLEIQRLNLPSEKDYNLAVEKATKRGEKKKLPSYEEATDSSLLMLIFVFYLIAIQISIPTIKTQKTFPGCIKSFTGYPISGKTDKTALTYIACVVNKISSSVKPWNSIYKLKESTIAKKMEGLIEEYIVPNKEIQELFKKKLVFLSLDESKIIPDEVDLKLWTSFLPPLLPLKIKDISPFPALFKDELATSIKTGKQSQLKSIDLINIKIKKLSLYIQEEIQKVIEKEKPILTNSNGDPFLENACCNSTNNTIEYFIKASPNIITTNNQVLYLSNILSDIMIMVYSTLFLDPRNTRDPFPELNPEFSENVIYKGFIYYCRFATNLPIDEELRAICSEKPKNITTNMSLEEQINILKLNGRKFTIENFNQLILYISQNNIINIEYTSNIVNNYIIFKDLLIYFSEQSSSLLSKDLLIKLNNILDSYDLTYQEDSEEIRDCKNYLVRQNDILKQTILDFMNKYSKLNKSKIKYFEECINNLCNFSDNNKNNKINKMINFSKRNIYNLISILPNIVINQIDYNNINIPKHWMLSEKHVNDIKQIIKNYYSNLSILYGDSQINMVLSKIQELCKDILKIVDKIYYQVNIIRNYKEYYFALDEKIITQLMLYFYYTILNQYINLAKNVEILDSTILKSKDEDIGIMAEEELSETLDIISGEQKLLATKIADIISEFIDIICSNKEIIDISYDNVMEKVLRSKEKEKTQITDYLKHLTDEEREIENIFKNSKLERWNVGLQKGLTQYVKETYDDEREKLEQQAILEEKLGINDLVTNMNKDIYMLDLIAEKSIEDQENLEQYNIAHIPDDDDYGERDGDEDF